MFSLLQIRQQILESCSKIQREELRIFKSEKMTLNFYTQIFKIDD